VAQNNREPGHLRLPGVGDVFFETQCSFVFAGTFDGIRWRDYRIVRQQVQGSHLDNAFFASISAELSLLRQWVVKPKRRSPSGGSRWWWRWRIISFRT